MNRRYDHVARPTPSTIQMQSERCAELVESVTDPEAKTALRALYGLIILIAARADSRPS